MQQNFDIFGRVENNPLILCNIDGEELSIMNIVKDVSGSMRYNAISELTFSVPNQSDNETVPYYDSVQSKKSVKIEGLGVFTIEGVKKVGDGIKEIKDVSAKSLEYEMSYKTVDYLQGTYPLYNAGNPQNTLLHEILQYIPNWTIGRVDVEFVTKYRTFDTEGQNVYDFLMNDVSQAYECVFEFDTFNRIINVKSPNNAIIKTDIFMSYRNLVKLIEVDENPNEMYTALRVYGSDGLDVGTINPIGSNLIYNFDYYKNTTWMSQGLIDSINTWEGKINNHLIPYSNLMVSLKDRNGERIGLVGDLIELQNQKQALQNIKDARVEQGLDYSDVDVEIGKKQTEINKKQAEINAKQTQINTVSANIKLVTDDCSLKNNFTARQLKKLNTFIIENTYENEWFVVVDSMTNEQIKNTALELYQDGKKALSKISKPTYRFSVDSINFVNLKEFADFARQLELASEVIIDMDDDTFIYPYLVGYDFDYENPNSFNLSFSDRLRYDDGNYDFGELFSDVSNLGSSAISRASDASVSANSAAERAETAYKNSVLANMGTFQNKFDLLDMGKKTQLLQQMADEIDGKVIQINEDVAVIGHTIAEKETEWNKISDITNAMGEVLAGKIAGSLNSSVNNIINADGTVKFLGNGILAHNNPSELLSTKATLLNANGLLVANTKNPDKTWKWTTAIDGDGINAGSIKTGILEAIKINGVEITGTTITGGTVKGAKFEAMEILSGTIKALDMTAGKIKGGTIEGSTIVGGTIMGNEILGLNITGANITGTTSITGAKIIGGEATFGGADNAKYVFQSNTKFRMMINSDSIADMGVFGYSDDVINKKSGCFSAFDINRLRNRTRYMANLIYNENSTFIIKSKDGVEIFGDVNVVGELSVRGRAV